MATAQPSRPQRARPADPLLAQGFAKIDADLGHLAQCLREMLEEVGERDLARLVPWVGEPAEETVETRPGAALDRELQMFSIAFQLLNMVEENTAAQIRRQRESQEGFLREPGLWGQNLRQLLNAGVSAEAIAEVLPTIHVEPVLTAHPTEAKRPVILRQHRALYLLLVQLENQMWTPVEREEIRRQIKVALERLWRTGETYLAKPDVPTEIENILHYLREAFPSVLPILDRRLRQAWEAAGLDPAMIAEPRQWPRLTFGSWVGGDRDGHPLVTAEVTQATLRRMREAALEVHRRHLSALEDRLSLSSTLQVVPSSALHLAERLASELGEEGRRIQARHPTEPWSQAAALMLARLPLGDRHPAYRSPRELIADLEALRRSLVEAGAARLAEADVVPVERAVRVFGFHLAALDIRQNSAFHDRALGQLLQAAGFREADFERWPEERRLAFLEAELQSPRPFAPRRAALGPEAREVLATYQVLVEHIDQHGADGVGALIVSMTRSLSDLLTVYVLAREAGLVRAEAEGLVCPVPVVPLFETLEDLERSPAILRAFLDHPLTRRSHALFGVAPPVQQVMVGYSDSNKDGGYFASQWHLMRAQDRMTSEARRAGFAIRFFHGRGGTPGRGAGPTHRFLAALPHGSVQGRLRMTEQGETIAQKYANPMTATHNLELLLAGVTATTLHHRGPRPPESDLDPILARLADTSREAYRALIEADGFLTYWSQATPIDALELSAIGSRPVHRTGQRRFEDLRAIPWVFSWNQSRHYLPGWFGIGSALERLFDEAPADFATLMQHVQTSPFLRFVLHNAETSHASVHLGLMRAYAELVEDAALRDRIFDRIVAEYHRFEHLVNLLFAEPRERRRQRMLKTIHLRAEGLRRLHLHQIALLRRWRDHLARGEEARAAEVLPTLLLSINAIASGLRTTG